MSEPHLCLSFMLHNGEGKPVHAKLRDVCDATLIKI